MYQTRNWPYRTVSNTEAEGLVLDCHTRDDDRNRPHRRNNRFISERWICEQKDGNAGSHPPALRRRPTMLTVHATKKLAQRLGGFTKDPTPSGGAPLTSWYATAIFWRPQVALFVDEHTLLPALLPLAPASTLLRRFPNTLAETLVGHDAPPDFIASALDRIGDGAVCVPTASRSMLGVVNEFVRLAGYALEDADGDLDLIGLAVWLADTPMSPLYKRHVSPDRELAALIGVQRL